MSILKDNLQEIKTQKDTYLLPENIKKGITVLGVTGTYESIANIKQFNSISEMNNNTKVNENDLAVVYRNEVTNMTSSSVVSSITFPEQVVLSEAVIDNAYCRLRAQDSSTMFVGNIMLDENRFGFDSFGGSSNIRVEYTSTDGITYNRTRFTGNSGKLENPVDLGTNVIIENETEWSNAMGQFMLVGGNIFEGLYTYKPYTDVTSYNILTNIKNYDSYNTVEFTLPDKLANMLAELDISTSLNPLTIYSNAQGLLVKTGDTTYDFYTGLCNRTSSKVTVMSDTIGIYINTTNNKLYYSTEPGTMASTTLCNDLSSTAESRHKILPVKWSLNLDTETSTFQVLKSSDFTSYVDGSYTHYNYTTPVNNTYAICGVSIKRNTSDVTITSVGFANDKRTTGSIRIANTIKNKYLLAPNQFTASADNLYNSIAYSKDGVINGNITTNVSNSFADINAEIYSKLQVAYNNMKPKVLTNDDVANGIINKSIYFIPVNVQGEPLLNTSKVTNMDNMFERCTNLTTIPLLNTSNVTRMSSMFNECTNLTTIPLLDTSKVITMSFMFQYTNLTTMPLLDTSKVTNMNNMFFECTNLATIPLLDTSKVTDISYMFMKCTNLTTIPLLNTNNATNMDSMFNKCTNLITMPLLDTSKVTRMYNMFDSCEKLSDESLNNILAMCTNATKITDNKALKYIGLTETQATKCTTLDNYTAFTNAGWTTGY